MEPGSRFERHACFCTAAQCVGQLVNRRERRPRHTTGTQLQEQTASPDRVDAASAVWTVRHFDEDFELVGVSVGYAIERFNVHGRVLDGDDLRATLPTVVEPGDTAGQIRVRW
jgi:hypothetical protein